jgi:cytosine/creatinine deaminase
MLLQALHIPAPLRGFEADAPSFDVRIDGDHIKSIAPSAAAPVGMLISCPVDVHAHLDKNYLVQRVGAACGDLHAAIELMAAERDAFTADDVRERMSRALEEAYAAGTRAMRTHLDWMSRERPVSLGVFEQLREAWRGKITLQAVSLTPLDYFEPDGAAAFDNEDLALEVATSHITANHAAGEATLMGAFVWKNSRIYDKLARVFALAQKNGLNLDFHVDEGLDAEARGLRAIAELTERFAMQGRVSCSHMCALSVQPHEEALATLALCARAGLHLVALPTTNAYLQGSWVRTPLERGIFPINEAAAAGISPCMATDNVADCFFPYGSYDLLDTFAFGVQLAHLHPADAWLASITTAPAAAMGLPWDGRLRPGAPADVLQLAARNAYELITPQGRKRRLMRQGQWT